jgi:hypothetical protein
MLLCEIKIKNKSEKGDHSWMKVLVGSINRASLSWSYFGGDGSAGVASAVHIHVKTKSHCSEED